jgi:hypothetical protein
MLYIWLNYLHVLGIFGFLMAHGISAGVAFALRSERNLERVRALLSLSAGSYGVMYLSLLVLLVSGIVNGFLGRWWGQGWIWVSLGLLVAILVAMFGMGSRTYGAARKASGLPNYESGKTNPPLETASDEEIDAILKTGQPVLLTGIGAGGLALIAWLMIFKPF